MIMLVGVILVILMVLFFEVKMVLDRLKLIFLVFMLNVVMNLML